MGGLEVVVLVSVEVEVEVEEGYKELVVLVAGVRLLRRGCGLR